MKRLSQTEISSLLARSAARHQEAAEEARELNRFFINLGKQAQEQCLAGEISREMFWGLVADYKAKLAEMLAAI